MKKTKIKKTVLAVITAVALSSASNVFAAVSPFSDVPSDSWTYSAVSKLATDKIIGIYSDNKTMSRFEMAQLVANAMTKTNLATSEDKDLINKLSAEFAEELNMLNNLPKMSKATSSKSESPQDPKSQFGKLKFSGMIDFGLEYVPQLNRAEATKAGRYGGQYSNFMGNAEKFAQATDFALVPEVDFDNNLSLHSLLILQPMNTPAATVQWKDVFLQYKTDHTLYKFGRIGTIPPFDTAIDTLGQGLVRNWGMIDDGAGAQFGNPKTDKVSAQIEYARKGAISAAGGGVMTLGADVRVKVTPELELSVAALNDHHLYRTFGFGGKYKGDGFNIIGEYGKNFAPLARTAKEMTGWLGSSYGTPGYYYVGDVPYFHNPIGWFLEVNTGNFNPMIQGTKSYSARYKSFQPGFDVSSYGGSTVAAYYNNGGSFKDQNDWKGVDLSYNYALRKQLMYNLTVGINKNYAGTQDKNWLLSYFTYVF